MAKKFIISGGGTGGHIFPAISIANALRNRFSNCEILFVGAENRMEMEKVPQAGYKIIGLPVAGIIRKFTLRNIGVLYKFYKSFRKARKIVKDFKPDVVIGVGGYASAPVLRAASGFDIPTVIQEQNSYAGLSNKMLGKKASSICVAYKNMEKFFPSEKIHITGNPVRKDLFNELNIVDAAAFFNLLPDKKTVLILGGSLGARSINESVLNCLEELKNMNDIQVIWQTGKYFSPKVELLDNITNITVVDFISRMDYAYKLADIIVSRAGAGTISELCIVGKPVVLIPSTNVAEDHQTKNALSLVEENAVIMIKDKELNDSLINTIKDLINHEKRCDILSKNISKLAITNSDELIVNEIEKLL